jgi:hypothetical protein
MTKKTVSERRVKATRDAMLRMVKACPEAVFVIVSADMDAEPGTLAITCVSSAGSELAIRLLEYGIDDFRNEHMTSVKHD